MGLEIKIKNPRKDLDFLNNRIDSCEFNMYRTKNLDSKINIMHLLNHYIKEREDIINKLKKI